LWRASDGALLRSFTALQGRRDLSFSSYTYGVCSVAFSPDGRQLAAGGADGQIRLWQLSDGSLQRAFGGHKNQITAVAFSPDGKTLASVGGVESDPLIRWGMSAGNSAAKGIIRLWRVSDGALLHTVAGAGNEITSVTFNPDGVSFAVVSNDDEYSSLTLYRNSDGALLRTLASYCIFTPPRTVSTGSQDDVTAVAFSPDGATFAAGGRDNLKLCRTGDGASVSRLLADFRVNSLAYSPFGVAVVSDGGISLWELNPPKIPAGAPSKPAAILIQDPCVAALTKALEMLNEHRAFDPLIALLDGSDRRLKQHAMAALQTITHQSLGEDAKKWKAWRKGNLR
jgi:WD40 repeat protein